MATYILDLADAGAARAAVAGGKGASLNKLQRLGYRVPPGFVLTTSAFAAFLEESGVSADLATLLREVSTKKNPSPERIMRVAERARALLMAAGIPEVVGRQLKVFATRYAAPFAVRSSATVEDGRLFSWAGQFDSYLNVKRSALAQRVKDCWLSLYNARALSYNPRAYAHPGSQAMAVIVEQMIPGDVAGVAFSVDPSHDDGNAPNVLVEAVRGLGERLVSGGGSDLAAAINPQTGAITTLSRSEHFPPDILPPNRLRKLAQTARDIEGAYGYPVDIEWAYKDSKLYLLQARPITEAERPQHPAVRRGKPELSDYELTFKVTGLPFLFADMLAHGFQYLDPLFTCDQAGSFRQYFSNHKMRSAARSGIEMFNRRGSVAEYRKDFTTFYEDARRKLDAVMSQSTLNRRSIASAFTVFSSLMTYYSKSDNEFTDAAYKLRDHNPIIRDNLDVLSGFKDVARVWVNDCLLKDDGYFARICERMASQFEVVLQDVSSYRVRELEELSSGKRVARQTLVARKKAYVTYYAGHQQRYIVGRPAVEYIAVTNRTLVVPGTSEVRGQVAHRTKRRFVKGPVNVINVDYGDLAAVDAAIAAMNKGDILVAEFTAPELLLACRKAKAIVTDLGGMLSHAAIVSRELRIPCLVGTRYATKALKTGDEVTIDFVSGTLTRMQPAPAAVSDAGSQ